MATGQNPTRRPRTGTSQAAARRPSTGLSTAARPQPKLVAVAGPANGQEYLLKGDELVVGRSSENAISIPDTSVSRKHAMVRKVEEGWAISDLGSGNGTLLNGEAIADETLLSNDDVISLGDTELKFVDAKRGGTGVRPARGGTGLNGATGTRGRVRTQRMMENAPEVAARRRKLLVIGVSIAAVLLAVGISVKAINYQHQKRESEKAKQREMTVKELSTEFQKAKKLIGQGKWDEAKVILEDIAAVAPEYETESIEQYLKRSDQEIPVQQALTAAQAALTARQVAATAQQLDKVKDDSVQRKTRDTMRKQLDALISDLQTEARTLRPGLTMSADSRDKWVRIKTIADDLLVARPDDKEMALFKSEAERAVDQIDHPGVAPVITGPGPQFAVMRRYSDGDIGGALTAAKQCATNPACKRLESQITEMQGKLAALESLSLKDMRVAYELDRQIAGGSSSEQSKPLRTRLSVQMYMEASKYKTSQQWVKAMGIAKDILTIDPSHAGATQIVRDGREQARQLFLRGYQIKDTDPDEAKRIFKEVLLIAPADDENYQKAKDWIDRLEKR